MPSDADLELVYGSGSTESENEIYNRLKGLLGCALARKVAKKNSWTT